MLLIASVPPVFSRKDPRNGEEIGRSYLASCIASWRRNGFRPISINRLDEVEAVKASGLIDCIGVSDEGVRFPNRFGPSLGAILDIVPPTEPVAIINADNYMLTSPGCSDLLSRLSRNSVVTARRIDVTHHGASRGEIFGLGYDLVAFNPAKIPKTVSNTCIRNFQLGAPWWDYVFAYSCSEELTAFRVKEPFLTHLLHPNRWDKDVWNGLAVEACRACPSIENASIRQAPGSTELGPAIGIAFIEAIFGSRFSEIEMPPFQNDTIYRTRPLAINNISQFRTGAIAKSGSRDWTFAIFLRVPWGTPKSLTLESVILSDEEFGGR